MEVELDEGGGDAVEEGGEEEGFQCGEGHCRWEMGGCCPSVRVLV